MLRVTFSTIMLNVVMVSVVMLSVVEPISMTHSSINFFVLSLFSAFMFVGLRVQQWVFLTNARAKLQL
jgi:hypothetical protein